MCRRHNSPASNSDTPILAKPEQNVTEVGYETTQK